MIAQKKKDRTSSGLSGWKKIVEPFPIKMLIYVHGEIENPKPLAIINVFERQLKW